MLLSACLLATLLSGVYSRGDAVFDQIPENTADGKVIVDREMFKGLLARIEDIEARDKTREKSEMLEIQTLRRQLFAQNRRTANLERIVKSLSKGFADSVNENDNIAEDEANGVGESTQQLKIEPRSTSKSGRIRRADIENPVAFFATLSKHMEHMGAHQPIVFDNAITNIGNAYNTHLGSFVAPVTGTYVFSTTLFSIPRINSHSQFVKNGQPVTTMYLSGSESGYDTTSQTIVLQLQKGDDVAVQNVDADKPLHGYNHSIFSGFLLLEDISGTSVIGK